MSERGEFRNRRKNKPTWHHNYVQAVFFFQSTSIRGPLLAICPLVSCVAVREGSSVQRRYWIVIDIEDLSGIGGRDWGCSKHDSSLSLFVCVFLCLSACLSVGRSICLRLPRVCVSARACLSVSLCLSAYCIYLSICLPVSVCVRASVCVSVRLLDWTAGRRAVCLKPSSRYSLIRASATEKTNYRSTHKACCFVLSTTNSIALLSCVQHSRWWTNTIHTTVQLSLEEALFIRRRRFLFEDRFRRPFSIS